jgi:hypothetical protein
MGSYLFQRTEDMLTFFRTDKARIRDGVTLPLNVDYWKQKLLAGDQRCGVKEFSLKTFREEVLRRVTEWEEAEAAEFEGTDPVDSELMQQVKAELIQPDFQFELEARTAVDEFSPPKGCEYPLQDFWVSDCQEYTYHYMWACYAIVWGIQQYDARDSNAKS